MPRATHVELVVNAGFLPDMAVTTPCAHDRGRDLSRVGELVGADALKAELLGRRLVDGIENAVGLVAFGGAFLADSGDEET